MVQYDTQQLSRNVRYVENVSTEEIEQLMLHDGLLHPVPARELMAFSADEISLFCLKHGFYQLPTTELIEFLQNEIGSETAIEIAAGNASIGRALNIPITDSKLQATNEMKALYESFHQKPITYPKDVLKMEATEAVNYYRPKVVIACWATQKWKPGYEDGLVGGVDEKNILRRVKKYILVGNEEIHEKKEIFRTASMTKYKFPWLYSRKKDQSGNAIWIIKGEKYQQST